MQFVKYQRSVNFEMSFWCLQFPPQNERKQVDVRFHKGKLQKEGIFFLIHLFARDILLMKKLEIEPPSIQLLKLI